jgi:hypothetical protein
MIDFAFENIFTNAGRKPQFDHETLFQEIKKIHHNARRSVRSLACAIGIPRRIIQRMKEDNKLRVYTIFEAKTKKCSSFEYAASLYLQD